MVPKITETSQLLQNGRARDDLFARSCNELGDFCFDEAVVDVFPDMIRRSVPGYRTLLALLGVVAERYVQASSFCYDLGCSLGAATLAVRGSIGSRACKIIAVDNSLPMIQRCRQILDQDRSDVAVDLLCADVRDVRVRHASLVLLNFTLQFIDPLDRYALLAKLCEGLLSGGALVLSEKIRFSDRSEETFHADLHHGFKRANGYSELEISRKRAALENVLKRDTLEEHRSRLLAAGFSTCRVWFQCLNFISLLAVK